MSGFDRPLKRKVAKMSKKRKSNPIDDEADLLASLGSSVQNMDKYEEDVLKSAELEAAPRLDGIGFPDLKKVAPSGAPISEVNNMQKVLAHLRGKELAAKPNNLRLLLKQQMLLNLIHSVTKDPDLCVRPQEERRQEDERRKRFRKSAQQAKQKQQTVGSGGLRNVSTTSQSQKKAPPKILKSALKKAGDGSKKRARVDEDENGANDDGDDEGKMTAGQRLEQIKKGNKGVSFAQVIETSRTIPAAKVKRTRRVGIQQRKKREGDSQTSRVAEEDEKEFEERKAYLKQIRKEREERRRARKQRFADPVAHTRTDEKEDVSSNDNDDDGPDADVDADTDADAGESEFQGGVNDDVDDDDVKIPATAIKQEPSEDIAETSPAVPEEIPSQQLAPVKLEDGSDNETMQEIDDASASNPQRVSVTCPICNSEVQTMDQQTADEALSQHMNSCQNARTRGQRRSTRARKVVKSYAEPDDEDDVDDDGGRGDDMTDEKPPSRKRRAVPSTTPRIKQQDEDNPNGNIAEPDNDKDSDVSVGDFGDDDNHDNNDNDDDMVLEDTAELKSEVRALRSRASRSTTRRATKAPPSPPPQPVKKEPVDDWDEDDYEDRVDAWIETGVKDMKVMKEQDTTETPPGEVEYEGGLVVPAWINDRLFPYQRTALQWMWELHQQQAGGIIGDEMGLGKTVQISAFLGSMASSRKLRSVLIICPATVLRHWLRELAKWAPGLRRVLIHQSGESADGIRRSISTTLLQNTDKWLKSARKNRLFEAIDEDDLDTRDPNSFCGTGYALVTTFENVRRNPEIWTGHKWSYVVMDEAQKIRNPDADVTLVCKRLRTPHRLALSGTPIQNDLKELWSLFDFVFPGRLGTLPAFEHEFADPIKRGGYSNASPMQVQLAYRCALILKDLINPYLLRRLKKDIKEVNRMPGKKEQVLFCRLSDRQRSLYQSFLQSDRLKSVLRGSAQLLGAITMLRKICNHPDLVCPPDQSSYEDFLKEGFQADTDTQDYSDEEASVSEEDSLIQRSGKLEVLAKILPLWKKQGHRVLVFCQWKKMLNLIQRFTELQGWKFGRLDGDTSVAARQRLVDNFNADESYFGMLCTTRTGGVGLNLTGADRIVLYDPDWNPQTDAQARERAWRFGQEREVTIYRLITAGTVEEKIYQRQIFKTALSNRVLQDPRQRRLFSQKDLKDLFTLKSDSGSVVSGGDGSTETSELTKGDGYVDPDEHVEEEMAEDDGETMRTVLKSKGLAGLFDHDVIEGGNDNDGKPNKKASVQEMERRAEKIARDALGALEDSVVGQEAYTPTWTGTDDSTTSTGRFGGGGGGSGGAGLSRILGRRGDESGMARIGGGNIIGAGIFSSAPASASSVATAAAAAAATSSSSPSSSGSLLATLRQRSEEIKSLGKPIRHEMSNTKEYTALLKRIRAYVAQSTPTTDALLDEFSSIPHYDAAVFRRLLKSVAVVDHGRWHLKR